MKPSLIILFLFSFLNSKAFHEEYPMQLDTFSVDTIIVTNVDCKGEATGSIDISILGGQEPYTYLWSTEDSTAEVKNRVLGEYSGFKV